MDNRHLHFDFWNLLSCGIFILMTTHGFAHAKVKISNFGPKILEHLGDIGIILNDFQSWF